MYQLILGTEAFFLCEDFLSFVFIMASVSQNVDCCWDKSRCLKMLLELWEMVMDFFSSQMISWLIEKIFSSLIDHENNH